MTGVVHVVGAGLAGLAAATKLAGWGRRVVLHEAGRMAGGRCRSYFDQQLGLTIDNGNHLLLACNHAAIAYLRRIGARDALAGSDECAFDFIDLASGARWRLAPNLGRIPWWIFSADRRVPDTSARDYLGGLGLLLAGADKTVAQALPAGGVLWKRLWTPVLVSALNTQLDEASARLAAAVVRESLGAGGAAARPRVPAHGLGPAFVDPALAWLATHGADIRYGDRLRALEFDSSRARLLDFGDRRIVLEDEDRVILAVPAWTAAELVPGLTAPTEHRAILNAHYAIAPPKDMPLLTGVVGGLTEWLFAFPDRLSVTISAADALIESGRDDLAEKIWREVATVARLGDAPTPPCRIVKEKRATFAATPAQDALRPDTRTRWNNLVLAGDWTQTGLPATIEGAIRSGDRAAEFV
jgi:squalene-associated FAD-dependent desaturase